MTPSASTMTVGRQLLASLAVPVVLLVAVGAVGALALGTVSDAKGDVLDGEVQEVVHALRLDAAVSEHGVAVRNFLITGDPSYEGTIEAADDTVDESLTSLDRLVDSAEGREALDDIGSRRSDLQRVLDDVLGRRAAGTIAPEDLAATIRDELTPVRSALTDAVDAFVDIEQRSIEGAVVDADQTVENTTRLLRALVVVGVALAIAVGGWMTRNVSRRLTGFALDIDAAASQILAGTTEQAAAASQQAAAVQETVATADELAQTADQSAQRARAVADAAHRSADVAHDGTSAITESSDAMARIRQQVDVIAATVVSLAERAQNISGIVRAVDDLSEQIHLLALNAAIEAARAGEHGRGFAVVASEIRALADQSKRATNDITGILGEIQQGTNTAVMATEEGGKSVSLGVERVERAGATIEELASTVADSALAAEQISASSGQQAVATSQISHAMRDMDDTAQQNAAAARQAEQAAQDLDQVATNLKALVGVR